MLKNIVRSFINNVDLKQAVAHSFCNWHAIGVDYLNLAYTPDLVAKLYFFSPRQMGKLLDDGCWGQGIVVNPHTHAYNFDTVVLAGSVINVVYEPIHSSHPYGVFWHEHKYVSPLQKTNVETSLSYDTEVVKLLGNPICQYRAWEGYSFDHKGIHSISVPVNTDVRTILFLLQYRNAGKPYTKLYTRTGERPDITGLYYPMSLDRAGELLDRAKSITGA